MFTNPTFLISRTFIFDAAHHLEGYQGKCSNIHGHRYELTVTFEATQNFDGIAYDFAEMKKQITDLIIDSLDHRSLNDFISIPTAENILLWIYLRIHNHLGLPNIYELTLKEGRDTWVTLKSKNFQLDPNSQVEKLKRSQDARSNTIS